MSVLEYGIGNGRVALPLARAGAEVVGVDLNLEMLKNLAARLQREPAAVRERLLWQRGDMRSKRLNRRFDLIIAPFNTVLHLYSLRDFERFFARVLEHLAPGGELVFDFSVPNPENLCRDPTRRYRAASHWRPKNGCRVLYSERFDYDPVRQILLVWMEFEPEGSLRPWRVPMTQRQLFPREAERMLREAGFHGLRFVADFNPGRALVDVDSLVIHARRSARRQARRVPEIQ
jgi:SAM-dependent methyltransferase